MPAPTVFVFDAYGTLFDVHAAVRRHAARLGPDAALVSDIWRAKQLEYSWVRTLTGTYLDFWTLTQQALDHALARVPTANREAREALLEAYWELDAYEEVLGVLAALKAQGHRTGVLSNGSPDMLRAAVNRAGLDRHLDAGLSVDPLRRYKTVEETYQLVTDEFRVYPEAVSFQSSNRWDVAGATAFGFRTVWVNRTNQPDEYGDLPPALVLADLNGLAP